MTSWISTPLTPPGVPVVRSTRASAMSCPRERSSPPARKVSACALSAAYAATPSATGSSAVRRAMVSGAGRRLTHRSPAAWDARCVTERGSRRYAAALAAATTARSPAPAKVPVSAANSSSTALRRAQACRFPDHQRGPPLIQPASIQRSQGTRDLRHQRLGQPEQPPAPGRRLTPGLRNLRRHSPALLRHRNPGLRLRKLLCK